MPWEAARSSPYRTPQHASKAKDGGQDKQHGIPHRLCQRTASGPNHLTPLCYHWRTMDPAPLGDKHRCVRPLRGGSTCANSPGGHQALPSYLSYPRKPMPLILMQEQCHFRHLVNRGRARLDGEREGWRIVLYEGGTHCQAEDNLSDTLTMGRTLCQRPWFLPCGSSRSLWSPPRRMHL
jgi:hypothetical protein